MEKIEFFAAVTELLGQPSLSLKTPTLSSGVGLLEISLNKCKKLTLKKYTRNSRKINKNNRIEVI